MQMYHVCWDDDHDYSDGRSTRPSFVVRGKTLTVIISAHRARRVPGLLNKASDSSRSALSNVAYSIVSCRMEGENEATAMNDKQWPSLAKLTSDAIHHLAHKIDSCK